MQKRALEYVDTKLYENLVFAAPPTRCGELHATAPTRVLPRHDMVVKRATVIQDASGWEHGEGCNGTVMTLFEHAYSRYRGTLQSCATANRISNSAKTRAYVFAASCPYPLTLKVSRLF